jgi:catechol 2,3-dioxygenase-like lactoylglutathione lyase family enzyme
VGVGSLSTALEFYRDVLGFNQVRSPSEGVIAAVVEAGPGQHIELVEGGTAKPDSLVFHVEDQARWKEHLSNLGVDSSVEGARLVVSDPDGLKIVLE